jgi:hypothetical protein
MACEDSVVGCFFDDRAPLAVPELNRERTLKYLECCYKHGMSWKDAEQQIQDCLQQRGVPREGIICVSWRFPAASAISISASLRRSNLLSGSIVSLRLAAMARFV